MFCLCEFLKLQRDKWKLSEQNCSGAALRIVENAGNCMAAARNPAADCYFNQNLRQGLESGQQQPSLELHVQAAAFRE